MKQVHTALLGSTSRLHSAHLPNAISAIFDQDEVFLLDENDLQLQTEDSSSNHQTYARTQACRRRLQYLILAYDSEDTIKEEMDSENEKFAAHMSRLAVKTDEVLARFPELSGHRFTGALSTTPLRPCDERPLCYSANSAYNDCLRRTELHRLLDEAMDGENDYFTGEFRDTLYTLIDGSEVNYTDVLSRSVLHLACQKGWEEGVEILLENGADPGVTTIYGSLPLHYAAAKGHLGTCKLLLEHDYQFDIDEEDCDGKMAVHYAKREGHESVADLLEPAPSSSGSAASTPEQAGVDRGAAAICLWIGCEAGDLGSPAELKSHLFSEHL